MFVCLFDMVFCLQRKGSISCQAPLVSCPWLLSTPYRSYSVQGLCSCVHGNLFLRNNKESTLKWMPALNCFLCWGKYRCIFISFLYLMCHVTLMFKKFVSFFVLTVSAVLYHTRIASSLCVCPSVCARHFNVLVCLSRQHVFSLEHCCFRCHQTYDF